MIQGLLVGARVARVWLRPAWQRVRPFVLRGRGASGARTRPLVLAGGAAARLRRLEQESEAIVDRALAARIEELDSAGESRAVRLRSATVAHLVGAGWQIGVRADEVRTLAVAGSLREIDARLAEAMAWSRDIDGVPETPAFHRRLALLQVVSDAAHPGARSEVELESLRSAMIAEEVHRRRIAVECIDRLRRELATGENETQAVLQRHWSRLEAASLTSEQLCECAGALQRLYSSRGQSR